MCEMNHYEVLGVDKEASSEEIKAKYRKIVGLSSFFFLFSCFFLVSLLFVSCLSLFSFLFFSFLSFLHYLTVIKRS